MEGERGGREEGGGRGQEGKEEVKFLAPNVLKMSHI